MNRAKVMITVVFLLAVAAAQYAAVRQMMAARDSLRGRRVGLYRAG